jgi:hypothetical protein
VAFDDDLTVAGETALGLASCTSMEVDTFVVVGTTLAVTGATTLTGALTADNIASATVVSGGTVTVASGATFEVNSSVADFSAFTEVNLLGDVNIGTDDGNTMTVNSLAQFNENVGFGANTITGAGGTITTSTVNGSTVNVTNLNVLDGVGSPSVSDGRVNYNGRRLSVGNGSTARAILSPLTAYVVSDDTSSSIEDLPGASIQLDIDDDEWVRVRVECYQSVAASGQSPTIRIAATNGVDVTMLNTGDGDAASKQLPATVAVNQARPNVLNVRWKPTNDIVSPDNTSWTIYVLHGVTGGSTVTTSNVEFQVRYE